MILHKGKNHPHFDEYDPVAELFIKSLKTAQGGKICLTLAGKPALNIEIGNQSNILIDFLEPMLLHIAHDETSFFDKIKKAKNFARMLTDNSLTITFLRKGTEAITLGSDAKPTLSRIFTHSSDVQINSIKQASSLEKELKED
jgi:hypothetical protein